MFLSCPSEVESLATPLKQIHTYCRATVLDLFPGRFCGSTSQIGSSGKSLWASSFKGHVFGTGGTLRTQRMSNLIKHSCIVQYSEIYSEITIA